MSGDVSSVRCYMRSSGMSVGLVATMLMASGCTFSWSSPKSVAPEQGESELETLYVADKDKVSVQLTSADSGRLKSALVEKLSKARRMILVLSRFLRVRIKTYELNAGRTPHL